MDQYWSLPSCLGSTESDYNSVELEPRRLKHMTQSTFDKHKEQ